MNSDLDNKEWRPLVEVLREEVQEYGGLYNLLDRQQKEIFDRDPESVMRTNEEIESHMIEMDGLRLKREELVRGLADSHECDREMSLTKMLPYFPEYIRPLLQALAEEVNAMVARTRRKARQNYLMLSRTMEIAREALRMTEPENYSKTYTRKGRVGMSGTSPNTYNTLV